MRWASARCKPQRRKAGSSQAWTGMAARGGAWQGKARPDCMRYGSLGQGPQTVAQRASALSAILYGRFGLGMARRGVAKFGRAVHGRIWSVKAKVTDGGTEGFGPLCHPQRMVVARPGAAWHDLTRRSTAWHGMARATSGSSSGVRAYPLRRLHYLQLCGLKSDYPRRNRRWRHSAVDRAGCHRPCR